METISILNDWEGNGMERCLKFFEYYEDAVDAARNDYKNNEIYEYEPEQFNVLLLEDENGKIWWYCEFEERRGDWTVCRLYSEGEGVYRNNDTLDPIDIEMNMRLEGSHPKIKNGELVRGED